MGASQSWWAFLILPLFQPGHFQIKLAPSRPFFEGHLFLGPLFIQLTGPSLSSLFRFPESRRFVLSLAACVHFFSHIFKLPRAIPSSSSRAVSSVDSWRIFITAFFNVFFFFRRLVSSESSIGFDHLFQSWRLSCTLGFESEAVKSD